MGLGTVIGDIARTQVSPAQTGLVLGGAAAAWSLRPSLLPRDESTQAAISVGSFAMGFGAGAGLNHVLRGGTRAVTGGGGSRAVTIARLGILGVGAGVGVLALPQRMKRDLPFANTIESAGRIALVAGLGSLGAQAHSYAVSRIGGTGSQRAIANAALIGAELVGLGVFLERRRRRYAETDSTTPSARTALVAGAAVAGSYLAVRGEMSVARQVLSKLTGTSSWKVHAGLGALAGAALVGGLAWKLTSGTKSEPLAVGHERPGAVGPGTGDSQFDTLGDASVRLLQGVQTAEEIEAITGRPGAVDPLRIAVGLESAPTSAARAELAVERMRDSGAFDRGTIFIAVAPGAGMIDDRLPASVELLANGDVATVAIPYSDRASFLSLDRIPDGADTLEALLDGIERETAERAARGEASPRIVLYGNSLGAWSGQEAFRDGGVDGVLDRIDRVLWVGNPGPSGWRQEVLFPPDGTEVAGRDRVFEFSDVDELDALDPAARERIAIWMHTRASDPVAKVDVDMLWRRPLYLQGEHRVDARVPENAAYVPGVSFLQELGDIVTTSKIADDPDRQAEGHTYRVDIVPDVAAAFFPGERDAELLARVETAVTAQEEQLGELRRAQQHPTAD
jgi:uncharacterized membrane protein